MPNNPYRVLAIDPGFDRVGVAVLEKEQGKEKLLFSTCLTTNPKDARSQRLFEIGQGLAIIIRDFEPKAFAIETLFFNQNSSSALGVAEARGVAIYQARCAGLTVSEYSPQEVKLAITGYGKADKIQMEMMVRKLISIPNSKQKRLDDEIDAIAVGITHLATTKAI